MVCDLDEMRMYPLDEKTSTRKTVLLSQLKVVIFRDDVKSKMSVEVSASHRRSTTIAFLHSQISDVQDEEFLRLITSSSRLSSCSAKTGWFPPAMIFKIKKFLIQYILE